MFLYKVKTDDTVNWTGALVTNAEAKEDLDLNTLAAGLSGMNGRVELILRGISISSVQQLAWEVDLWTSATHTTTDPNTDAFVGCWAFGASGTPGDGAQIAATGLYRYYIDGLEIPLWDDDQTGTGGSATDPLRYSGKLHASLINRSVTSKIAGTSGRITVTFWVEVMQAGSGA